MANTPLETREQLAAKLLAELGEHELSITPDGMHVDGWLDFGRAELEVIRDALMEFLFYRLDPAEQRRLIEPRNIAKPLPPTENEMKAIGIFAALADRPGIRVIDESKSGFPRIPCIKRYCMEKDDYLWVECDDPMLIREYLRIFPGMANEQAVELLQD